MLDAQDHARHMTLAEAAREARGGAAPILCHAQAVARRLGIQPFPALDVLELFAFAHPAAFCLPTAVGLATALGLPRPRGAEEEARTLRRCAERLIAHIGSGALHAPGDALPIARAMKEGGWGWGEAAVAALEDAGAADPLRRTLRGGIDVWRRLREWTEYAPEPPPANHPVEPAEARRRLAQLVGADAEPRPQQSDYASSACAAFSPRETPDAPNAVIAEAGTGVGKTLGYIAPASLWAEKNEGTVWISTFTRNLQRQIDQELDRLYPDPAVKARRVVLRKGRENYLCLLNLEEAAASIPTRRASAVAIGLMARWASATRSGDIVAGDFPTWLADLAGFRDTIALADRRGECIYSACPHYSRCFIERAVRSARRADIVVANHALVMTQAALGGLDDSSVPTRLVFDEGHHVFDAADSAFSAELSGRQGAELRRWLLGAEGAGGSRARGLARRVEEIAAQDGEAGEALAAIAAAAAELPGATWQRRIAEGRPRGAAEAFLQRVRQQVYARTKDADAPYDIEADTAPPVDGLLDAAAALETALAALAAPMKALTGRLARMLDEDAAELDSHTRQKIESVCRSLRRRAEGEIGAWRSMLAALQAETPAEYVDWFSIVRAEGRDVDAAMHRHWVDPTLPFARAVMDAAHGVLITSATLRDGTGDVEADWGAAEAVSGALHLAAPALRAQVPSPFDYAAQTRVFIVTDVQRGSADQVAAAYRELFIAAGGGALGLFTAIARLRAVHGRVAPELEDAGLALYAQHVDRLDAASLVDIFRAEENACLLGTDALRDGVDVPGRSLRLVVFDRVPWPRPSILHRARRAAFDAKVYDDRIARMRIRQAFGRLIRRADDHGVFVLLDSMTPTRLLGAFPDGVPVARVGLAEAIDGTRVFLTQGASAHDS
ncbi:MAG: ATP-dependent DNA helicase [Alphaproteobacteria bacterium]|nr:ATP-dependent DNA helicase [Alphaproteobacteria bacterium]